MSPNPRCPSHYTSKSPAVLLCNEHKTQIAILHNNSTNNSILLYVKEGDYFMHRNVIILPFYLPQNMFCLDCLRKETSLIEELLSRGINRRTCVPEVAHYSHCSNLSISFPAG